MCSKTFIEADSEQVCLGLFVPSTIFMPGFKETMKQVVEMKVEEKKASCLKKKKEGLLDYHFPDCSFGLSVSGQF